jgi:hypothetical protein
MIKIAPRAVRTAGFRKRLVETLVNSFVSGTTGNLVLVGISRTVTIVVEPIADFFRGYAHGCLASIFIQSIVVEPPLMANQGTNTGHANRIGVRSSRTAILAETAVVGIGEKIEVLVGQAIAVVVGFVARLDAFIGGLTGVFTSVLMVIVDVEEVHIAIAHGTIAVNAQLVCVRKGALGARSRIATVVVCTDELDAECRVAILIDVAFENTGSFPAYFRG